MRTIHNQCAPLRQGRPGRPGRSGFTVIELLVVIAIIAVLTSLVAAGIFRFFNVQKQSNTELTITTLNNRLKSQWDGVLKSARAEDIPVGIVAMAGGHPQPMQLARVIWIKYRLKMEFPTSFAEATNPYPALDGGGNANPFMTNVQTTSFYRTDMSTMGVNNATSSSAFLLLAMTRRRGGSVVSIEDMGAGAVAEVNQVGLRQFIDGWGNPLKFDRWLTSPPAIFAEVDGNLPGSPTARFRDPLDPQGLLLNPSWNNSNNFTTRQGVYWFEQIFHSVHTGAGNTYQPQTAYLVPVISSAGPNGIYGDDDDVWGFRLRMGAKGDK